MTALVIPLRPYAKPRSPVLVPRPAPEPPVALELTLYEQQRLELLELLAGRWSDSVLIAALATATPIDRGIIIRELELRARR